MTATKIGLTYLKSSHLIRMMIIPINDSDLDKPEFNEPEYHMVKVDKREYDKLSPEEIPQFIKDTAKKLPGPTSSSHGFIWPDWNGNCNIIDPKDGKVINVLVMDPDHHKFLPNHLHFGHKIIPVMTNEFGKGDRYWKGEFQKRYVKISLNKKKQLSTVKKIIWANKPPKEEKENEFWLPDLTLKIGDKILRNITFTTPKFNDVVHQPKTIGTEVF